VRALAALYVVAASVGTSDARAQDEVDPYARIIVDTAVIRSGPSPSYQRVYVAERGEVFPVRGRATRGGYWYELELPDGTHGWLMGELVYVHEVSEEEADGGRFLSWLFAPPPLPTAVGELSVTAGVIGETFGFNGAIGGFMALRPTVYLAPTFGIEATAGASVSEGGRIYVFTLGGIANLFPESPVVPYAVIGGGYARSDPNLDTFLLQSGDLATVYGGGGLRFGFRYRLTLRIEVRAWAFFTPEKVIPQEELTGGLTVFF
jgi:hypothetical protein